MYRPRVRRLNKVNVAVSVPGAVPVDSILGSSYEQQISLSWREPLQTYGLIRQYEVRPRPRILGKVMCRLTEHNTPSVHEK